jgi:RimJ/RimL family protein N-acetyltransferase
VIPPLRTERLLLREWRESDIAPFAAMNADPNVMEFFPALRTANETRGLVDRLTASFAADRMGFWALELPGEAPFIGFTGIMRVGFAAPFTPAVEIGWRLAPRFWGMGLATEAARAALADGFGRCGLREIVSFAVPGNARSRAVMERIGMVHDADGDFDHPSIALDHRFCRHVLYRISAPGKEG